jgi:hypothetical protein
MLLIKNIHKLKKKKIGDWEFAQIDEDYYHLPNPIAKNNYLIRMSRAHSTGAAIVIEKEIKNNMYSVTIHYDTYTNVIATHTFSKDALEDRDSFLSTIRLILDKQYDKYK